MVQRVATCVWVVTVRNLGYQTEIALVNYRSDVPYDFCGPSGLCAYFWSVQYQIVPRSPAADICGCLCSQGRAFVTPAHARRVEERLCLRGPSDLRSRNDTRTYEE